MNKYDQLKMIQTRCDSIYDVRELVANFFIENRDDETVLVRNTKNGVVEKEQIFDLYDPEIVRLINIELQVAHFGGTLQ